MALQYLNTDLELRAEFVLRDLVQDLSAAGLFLLNGDTLAHGFAVLEICGEASTPAVTIVTMLTAIETLPNASRSAWDRCTSRTFDVGFRSGDAPHSISALLPSDVLQRIAAVGASVAVTVYATQLAEHGHEA